MTSILDRIVARKPQEIAEARARVSEADLELRIAKMGSPRDFLAALQGEPGEVRIIAEVKKASPSAGIIREDFDPVSTAKIYEDNGASAVSVLTDTPGFQGKLEYLEAVRQSIDLPVLRKDFLIDPYQVLEARAAGADTVLLIAEILDVSTLRSLLELSRSLGMEPLVELYEPENLAKVLEAGATIVGINNRNLRTFETDLEHTGRLLELIPKEKVVVSESGIRTHADLERVGRQGARAVLVGESLMRAADIGQALRTLRSG